MWTNENRALEDRGKPGYPSDLTDNEWTDCHQLVICQVAPAPQLATVISGAVFVRPRRAAPANRSIAIEPQVTPKIQGVLG